MNEFSGRYVESYDLNDDPLVHADIERVKEYWAGKQLGDVMAEMPAPTIVKVEDMYDVALVEIQPDGSDYDQTREIVMALPYLNGLTPHHYIRAKTLQQLIAPDHRVWMIPNVIDNKPAYTFTGEQKNRLSQGDALPLGEIQARAFEVIERRSKYGLGALSVTGYSMGGLIALAMGAVNSPLPIERVNADEAPSVTDRGAKQLQKDFIKSGGIGNLRAAVKAAEIPALSQAMSMPRLAKDLVRFAIASKTETGEVIHEAMAGTANDLVRRTIQHGIPVKLGRVAGSTLFDPGSIQENSDGLRFVDYEGEMFSHKHATGDNVIAHAVMARHGLLRK